MSLAETLREDVLLAPYTTIGLGGRARYFATCRSLDDLRAGLAWAAAECLPVQVLGGGSNLIFPDRGFPGLVLHIGLRGVDFTHGGPAVRVTAAAGEDWDGFVQACVARGLGGIECLSGIPGQVGAAPVQNVGAYGQEVQETISQVRALDRRTLEIADFAGGECRFAYRRSRFKGEDRDRYVIFEVAFHLRRGTRPELRYPELRQRLDPDALEPGAPGLGAVRAAVLALRRGKSMIADPADPNARSVGSFFINPVLTEAEFAALQVRVDDPEAIPTFPAPGGGVKIPAAWLVEQAGFRRGHRRGGVGVSERHALALVNRGGTTGELLGLASEIEGAVRARFGIRLEREPVVVEE